MIHSVPSFLLLELGYSFYRIACNRSVCYLHRLVLILAGDTHLEIILLFWVIQFFRA